LSGKFLKMESPGRDNKRNGNYQAGEEWLNRGIRAQRDGSYAAAKSDFENATAAFAKAIQDYSSDSGGFSFK
jgi:hypothetical protein